MSEFRINNDKWDKKKVRKGVDIFDKRILDSCKFISNSASEYGLVYINLFFAVGRVYTGIKGHGAQPIRILIQGLQSSRL